MQSDGSLEARRAMQWACKAGSVRQCASEVAPEAQPTGNSKRPEIERVIFSLHIENDTPGDWNGAAELVATLREYIAFVEAGQAGREMCETYEGPRGSRLTVTCSELLTTARIPLSAPQLVRHRLPLYGEQAMLPPVRPPRNA